MIEKIIFALIGCIIGSVPTYLFMKVKKRHTLEIEKKKVIYHEKLELFKGYLKNLKEFRQKLTKSFTEKEYPSIMNAFYNSANAIESKDDGALIKELLKPLNIIMEFSKETESEFQKFMTETTTFKLIGTPEMRTILDEIKKLLDEYYNCVNPYIESLKKQVEDISLENVKLEFDAISNVGKRLEEKERQLEALMRKELEEI